MSSHQPHLPYTRWRRSAAASAWLTLHAFLACSFLRLGLGEYQNGDVQTGIFELASMAKVMQYLSIPLPSLLAFSLFFLVAIVTFQGLALLCRRAVQACGVSDLDELAAKALGWAVKRQLLSPWLIVTLLVAGALFGAFEWWYRDPGSNLAVWWLILIPIGVQPLIQRPRWLGAASLGRAWLPSAAAFGVYVALSFVMELITRLIPPGLNHVGGVLWWLAGYCLYWVTSSVLLFVRSSQDTCPNLRSRVRPRLFALAALAGCRCASHLTIWLLPPTLLILFYSLFIASTVHEVQAALPATIATANSLSYVVLAWLSDRWSIAGWAFLITGGSLYVGRCLVLLNLSERPEQGNANPADPPV